MHMQKCDHLLYSPEYLVNLWKRLVDMAQRGEGLHGVIVLSVWISQLLLENVIHPDVHSDDFNQDPS